MHTLGNKETVASGVLIKHKGYFDFEGLYRSMIGWFDKYKYDFHEDRYKDKTFTKLGPEIEPKWRAERKVTEYIRFDMKVTWHIWEGKEVEVEIDGVKKKRTTGRLSIELKGTVLLDYTGIFSKKKFLGTLYKKLLDREIRSKYLSVLEDEVFKLQTQIKSYLNHLGKEQAYYTNPAIVKQEYRKDI